MKLTTKITEAVKVTESTLGSFHHLPDHQYHVEIRGLSLRKALKVLRNVDFGNIGGTYDMFLSDGTTISVELESDSGGGHLMNSQKVRRCKNGSTIRKYSL